MENFITNPMGVLFFDLFTSTYRTTKEIGREVVLMPQVVYGTLFPLKNAPPPSEHLGLFWWEQKLIFFAPAATNTSRVKIAPISS